MMVLLGFCYIFGVDFTLLKFNRLVCICLGSKTQKTVFLAQNPNEFEHISVPLASDTQGTVVPSTISEDSAAYVRKKLSSKHPKAIRRK